MRTANAALTALLNGQRKALKFDGAALRYVTIPSANLVTVLNGRSWTIEVCCRFDSVANLNGQTVWGSRAQTRMRLLGAVPGWQGAQVLSFAEENVVALGCGVPFSVGIPFRAMFTYDGTTVRCYKDGVAPQTLASAGWTPQGPYAPQANYSIGEAVSATFTPNGFIDDVRVYARTLSATEALEHQQGVFRDESGLVGYWPLDEGTGATAFDLSGIGNNGTITNSPVPIDYNQHPGSERQLRIADLVTITMINGTTLRYTSSDSDITSGGFLFDSKGPLFTRGKTKLTTGIAVDVMDLTVMPSPSHLINGMPFMQAVTLGFFDGAIVQVERAFMPAWGNVSTGTLIMFTGRVSDMESSRSRVEFKVKSDLELLNILMPRNIYQPGCVHTLYDNGCTAKKALFAVRSTVAGGSTTSSINSALATVASEFELGTIEFEAAASLPGTVGNYITTPDAPANRLTGDAMWTAKVSLTDWTPAVLNAVICKRLGATAATASYVFGVNSGGGQLLLFWSDGATQFIVNSTIAPTVADGAVLWIRATLTVNNGAGGNDVRFWTSLDNITWTQLGATVTTAGVTSIRAGTDFIELGTQLGGTASPLSGKIYYADIRNGINGPIVAKFDPTIDTPQGTGILSSTGELWSMVGTPALVGMTNRGVRRTVKAFSAGNFALIQPLPNAPVTGDLFAAYAGCDKLQSTCGTKIGITYTVDNTTDIFTATAHGLTNDLAVKLTTTGTFPTTVPALDAATPYFVINAAANTFQLARSPGGPAIDMSSNGTGVNKVAMKGKFANLDNYRGFPYVPIPETMI